NARKFNGTIDEVAIWNRSLTADEIRSLYLGGLSLHRNDDNLVFSAGNATVTSDISSWSNNEWHHIAGSYGSSSATLYIDGDAKSTESFAETSFIGNDTYIGGDWINSSAFSFNGILDEVRIYNRTLSSTELDWSYNRGLEGKNTNVSSTGLVGEWHLNETSGTTAVDSSVESNNGILYRFRFAPKYNASGGRFGGAFEFNGLDDWVSATTTGFNSEAGTLEAWFKPSTVAGNHTIFSIPQEPAPVSAGLVLAMDFDGPYETTDG
ncbi:unnamed protein product, partial [marine sediment metagenome]